MIQNGNATNSVPPIRLPTVVMPMLVSSPLSAKPQLIRPRVAVGWNRLSSKGRPRKPTLAMTCWVPPIDKCERAVERERHPRDVAAGLEEHAAIR